MFIKRSRVLGEDIRSVPGETQHSPGTRHTIVLPLGNSEVASPPVLFEEADERGEGVRAGSLHTWITIIYHTVTLE